MVFNVKTTTNFMTAWVREEEKACENRQRKRETEEVNKVKVAPGVTLGTLGRFRAVLIDRLKDSPSDVSCAR